MFRVLPVEQKSLLVTRQTHIDRQVDVCTRLYAHTLGLIQGGGEGARTAISGMRPFFLHGSFTPFVRTESRGRYIQRDIH